MPSEFYHGTSLEAALSIQKAGFRVELSGTNAGAMLGDGVYITTTLEKALNYAKVKPHAGAIFKLKVRLGNCRKVGHKDPMMRVWHLHGYDSAWSPAGSNGVREENCVRDPSRIKIVDVILGHTGEAGRAGFRVQDGQLERTGPPCQCQQCSGSGGVQRGGGSRGGRGGRLVPGHRAGGGGGGGGGAQLLSAPIGSSPIRQHGGERVAECIMVLMMERLCWFVLGLAV
jgi:hypothetical protein